ncbi:MAG TPA: family 16 glycoside hydrolase [Verrucomicrobiae bacterium]
MPAFFRFQKQRLFFITFALITCAFSSENIAPAEEGFRSIFDGSSLAEWAPRDASYWSVENGAIVGRITKERPCTTNQYLVWKGGELADFELKLEMRLNGEGGINGGFQFRSRLLPDGDVCGYQMDNNLGTEWLARLYDEYGRHDLALRGERAVFDANGKRNAQPLDASIPKPPANFRLEDWHEYHLTCVGGKISLRVNGRLIAEVEDNDPRRAEPQGVLALQLHSGPPTVTEFRNIRVKVLKAADTNVIADWRLAPLRRKLFDGALTWWLLDAGGHGARVPLRLNPEFYQFELNVVAAGKGAVPKAKVTVLDGAYFDGGKELHASGEELTVYLRLRDPAGKWDSALMGKRANEAEGPVHFNLFSAELPDHGRAISFHIKTERNAATASFFVSEIDATAWHDLVGRYDGKSVALFCDGRKMASAPLQGKLVPNSFPLLIGAANAEGKSARHFRGEVEECAIWERVLSDAEIAALWPK